MIDVAQSNSTIRAGGRTPLIDGHGRRIHHLRLSVISACNLRCIYCKPQADGNGTRRLTDRNRAEIVRFLFEHYGLSQVRVTGGEPLLYPQLLELIATLREIAPSLSVAMTTNAQGLAGQVDRAARVIIEHAQASSRPRRIAGWSIEAQLEQRGVLKVDAIVTAFVS